MIGQPSPVLIVEDEHGHVVVNADTRYGIDAEYVLDLIELYARNEELFTNVMDLIRELNKGLNPGGISA